MLVYIFQKTLWKYKTNNDDFNKIMINHIINKNKNSILFSYYQNFTNKNSYSQSYIYKIYNLYQSIKLLIKITEDENKNIIYHPILLNKNFHQIFLQNLENQNKIIVKRKTKKNKKIDNISNDIKIDNSLSSIKKTIDLDERDNIQKGCLDFATGNEMLLLLKYFQKNSNECLYNNYNKNCNIYKKKKSPQNSFRAFSPKNKYFFGEFDFSDKINNNNMINNNIYINNNNFNNHTNFIINNYKDIKEIDNKINFNDKKKIKYEFLNNLNSQTQSNIFSNRLTYRNRFSLPLSQSCEKFIYTKKYISSKIKKKKIGNKTEEIQEKENEDEENKLDEINNLNNIKVKYIPFINKNSKIKIIEKSEKKEDNKKETKQKMNYIGRNNYNKVNKNRFPFLLSRITKNNKNNRKPNLTQAQYSTQFNSTFNLNYHSSFKTNPINIDKSKIEKSQNNNLNKDYKNHHNIKSNPLININNKKNKKNIKRKENNITLIKNYTSNNNLKRNDNLRKNLYNLEERKTEKGKIIKTKEERQIKSNNLMNTNRFISPKLNKVNTIKIASNTQFTSKNKSKKTLFKNLTNQKNSNNFSKINKSNRNLNSGINKNNTTTIMKKVLLNSKSNGSINTFSKQFFSPVTRKSFYINNIGLYTNENIINNNNEEYNYNTNQNDYNCFNTLPNNPIKQNNKEFKRKTVSPLKTKKDNCLRKISTKNKNYKVPIKVNVNKKCFNDSLKNKINNNKKIKNYHSNESFDLDSNKFLFLTSNRLFKEKINLKKNSMQTNQIIFNN